MQTVIDGILTNYQVFGEKAQVVLILPGWRRPINEWLSIAKNLVDRYQVLLLDLPGFGSTSMPKENFGVFDYADFVKEFLAKLKIEKCIVLGHSFGGRLGIVLASEGDLVDKLILVDSGGIENKSLYAKLMHLLRLISSPIVSVLPASTKNKIANLIGSEDYKTSGELRKIFVRIVNQDLRHLLPKIKVQTFILWGDKDKTLPVSHSKIFKKMISNSTVRIVWGSGHDPHLEKPEQFISILKDIL